VDTNRSGAPAGGHIAVSSKGWPTKGALERLQSGGMFLRNHVEHIDTNALQWQQTGAGVHTKIINANQDCGSRTVLVKLVPEEGFDPPSKIHYHSLSEELLVLDGLLTFDHKTWLDGISYIYHPPFMIHGFKSATPETTTLLARGTGELDFNFPDPSKVDISSPVDGSTPTRDLLYLNNINEKEWSPFYGDDCQKIGEMLSLGTNSQTGEGECFERYFPGWTRAAISGGFTVYMKSTSLRARFHQDPLMSGPRDTIGTVHQKLRSPLCSRDLEHWFSDVLDDRFSGLLLA
jgi:hypothetical protein